VNAVAAIVAGLQPVVSSLASSFGATVSVSRLTQTSQADGSTADSWTSDVTLVSVPCFLVSPESARRKHVFGISARTTLVVLIPARASGLVTIAQGDGLTVTAGPYSGRVFVAETVGMPDVAGVTVAIPCLEVEALP